MRKEILFAGITKDTRSLVSGYYVKMWISTLKDDGRFAHYIYNQQIDEDGHQMWNMQYEVFPETLRSYIITYDDDNKQIDNRVIWQPDMV